MSVAAQDDAPSPEEARYAVYLEKGLAQPVAPAAWPAAAPAPTPHAVPAPPPASSGADPASDMTGDDAAATADGDGDMEVD